MKKLFLGIGILVLIVGAGCAKTAPQAPTDKPPMDNDVVTSNPTTTPQIPTESTTTPVMPTTTPATSTSTPPATTTPSKDPVTKIYSMTEVASAKTPEKCWTVIRGEVYDLTAWMAKHPGGDKAILSLCGIDGTEKFVNKHGGQPKMEETLKGFEIGMLKK